MKLKVCVPFRLVDLAAAFGRLCVETFQACASLAGSIAAAFGRLCVETAPFTEIILMSWAAAFGRLCVETLQMGKFIGKMGSSRLRAAVC